MKSRLVVVCLLAGVSTSTLSAGDQPPRSRANDSSEQESEKVLTAIIGQCQKMLDLQIAVYNGTKDLCKVVEANADKKPRPQDQEALLKLSGTAKQIVMEVNQAIQLVEGEAVAFPEVFRELRKHMKDVQARLQTGDVGIVAQAIERDIIETLEDMITALQKR
jgi:hypothetical protein